MAQKTGRACCRRTAPLAKQARWAAANRSPVATKTTRRSKALAEQTRGSAAERSTVADQADRPAGRAETMAAKAFGAATPWPSDAPKPDGSTLERRRGRQPAERTVTLSS